VDDHIIFDYQSNINENCSTMAITWLIVSGIMKVNNPKNVYIISGNNIMGDLFSGFKIALRLLAEVKYVNRTVKYVNRTIRRVFSWPFFPLIINLFKFWFLELLNIILKGHIFKYLELFMSVLWVYQLIFTNAHYHFLIWIVGKIFFI